MSFVKYEVRSLNEQTGRWTYLRAPRTKPRVIDEEFNPRLHTIEYAVGGGCAVETDIGVNLNQILPGLRRPDKINWHGLGRPYSVPTVVAPRGVHSQSPQG